MNNRLWLALAALPWAAFSPLAWASEGESVPPELESYVNLPAHNLTTGAIVGQQAALLPPCKSDTARLAGVSVLKNVRFDGAKRRPVEGAWKETWRVDGCEISGVFNVLVIFGAPGRMSVAPLPPGVSLADPVLQKNASAYAAAASVKLGAPDCKGSRIIDTRFVKFEGGAPAGASNGAPEFPAPEGKPTLAQKPTRPWREEWTVDVCGVQVIAPLVFTPELTGISVKAIPEEARKK